MICAYLDCSITLTNIRTDNIKQFVSYIIISENIQKPYINMYGNICENFNAIAMKHEQIYILDSTV